MFRGCIATYLGNACVDILNVVITKIVVVAIIE